MVNENVQLLYTIRCRKNAIQVSALSGWLGSLTMSGPHLVDTTRWASLIVSEPYSTRRG